MIKAAIRPVLNRVIARERFNDSPLYAAYISGVGFGEEHFPSTWRRCSRTSLHRDRTLGLQH